MFVMNTVLSCTKCMSKACGGQRDRMTCAENGDNGIVLERLAFCFAGVIIKSVKVKVNDSQCQSFFRLKSGYGGVSVSKSISEVIEQHLKRIIEQSQSGMIELQRSELAELFQCVPSQINYVISTRFSIEQGYIVESKRGGGGYIRIRQVGLESDAALLDMIRTLGSSLSQREAEGLVDRLEREEFLTIREANMLRAASRRDVLLLELPLRDEVRARLVANMLMVLLLSE